MRSFFAALSVVFIAGSLNAVPVGVQARGKIKHVVIIVQENRTFDNIFGGDPKNGTKPNFKGCPASAVPFPGADASFDPRVAAKMQCGLYSAGNVQASHDVWECLYKWTPPFSADAWNNLTKQSSDGVNDGCAGDTSHSVSISCPNGKTKKLVWMGAVPYPFVYLSNELRHTYWDIASKYVLGDRFFAASSTASFPGHQYIVADQSVDAYHDIVADQPIGGDCLAVQQFVQVPALADDGYSCMKTTGPGGACYNHTTLADLLQSKQIPWTHYTTKQWNAQTHQFDRSNVFDGFINYSKWAQQTRSWPTSLENLQTDIQNGKLGGVTWVKPPCMPLSDHPGISTNDAANWVGSVVNWIGANKSLWNETAIFVLWDDWGGFYDHVVPPKTRPDRLGPGARIPFLLISPYGVNGTVVHTQADYASVLKFTEDLFGLGSLTDTDKNAADLTGFFDFSKQRPFVPVWVQAMFKPSMCQTGGNWTAEMIDR